MQAGRPAGDAPVARRRTAPASRSRMRPAPPRNGGPDRPAVYPSPDR
jgi:hypothetical protein